MEKNEVPKKVTWKAVLECIILGMLIGAAVVFLYDFLKNNKGHAVVDLGLSVRWAQANVGAKNALDCGLHSSYTDAEQAAWGGKWRMPTDEEWNELLSKCFVKKYVDEKYGEGYVFVGPNGKKLYLPKSNDIGVVYWSSTVSDNFFVTENSSTTKGDARLCMMMTDSMRLSGFPFPEMTSTISTRLVCE